MNALFSKVALFYLVHPNNETLSNLLSKWLLKKRETFGSLSF